MAKILIVDDEPDLSAAFGRYFERTGHDVLLAGTGAEAIAMVETEHPAVMLLDLKLPDMTGFDVLARTREHRPIVVMVTGYADVALAVQAMQSGAEGFLTKPVELAHLGAVVDRALEKAQLRDLSRAAGARLGRMSTETLLGSSSPMREVAEQIELLARSERTVALLVGELGTGKGRVARAIHALSERGGRAFHELDCSMRSLEELTLELFGVERSVGGPVPGLFEAADGGTLFLDEIADLPDSLQPMLLRAIETRRVRRSGGTREVLVDVRDDTRSRDRSDRRPLSRGSLLPPWRDAAPPAAAARPFARGHRGERSGARRGASTRFARRAARRQWRGAGADRRLSMARQRARAPQRARARAAAGARRSGRAAGAPAGGSARIG